MRVELLVEQSRAMLEAEQYDEAVALLDVAVRMSPNDEAIRQALREMLQEQIQDLYRTFKPVQIPRVVADAERVRQIKLKPEERHLLERLSAGLDVGTLVMMSSMTERETLKALKKFLHSSLIAMS